MNNGIQFDAANPNKYATATVKCFDNGREIRTNVTLPQVDSTTQIKAILNVHPVPNSSGYVYDTWDRAASFHLLTEDSNRIELVKMCTGFGGDTRHEQDVSSLAPLLKGNVTICGFIDTWLPNAWKVELKLKYTRNSTTVNPSQVIPIISWKEFKRKDITAVKPSITFTIPQKTYKSVLTLYTSGHAINDNPDEFTTKEHVLYVDGKEVFRRSPWRSDCKSFRSVNPYSAIWEGDIWSSDLDRSNWCPGDEVVPFLIDLTKSLPPGQHTIRLSIENIHFVNDTQFGYWRVSSFLSNWGPEQTAILTKGINFSNTNTCRIYNAESQIIVRFQNSTPSSYKSIALVDISGKKRIISVDQNSRSITLDLSRYISVNGSYIVIVTDGPEKFVKKILYIQ